MFLIGLTGGIASGKSTVSHIFKNEYGVPVVDADQAARKVVKPNTKGWKRVIKIFGNDILNEDQTINREKLAEIIFNDSSKRKQLNKCLHALIAFEMIKQIFWLFIKGFSIFDNLEMDKFQLLNFYLVLKKGYRYAILDVPLLFETKIAMSLLSFKVVVYCQDESEQIRRLLLRNKNLTEADARLRIDAQMSNSQRLRLADYSINNSENLENTRKQIKNLNEIFKNSKKYLFLRIGLFLGFICFISGTGLTLTFIATRF